jgi:hypothetical protein
MTAPAASTSTTLGHAATPLSGGAIQLGSQIEPEMVRQRDPDLAPNGRIAQYV